MQTTIPRTHSVLSHFIFYTNWIAGIAKNQGSSMSPLYKSKSNLWNPQRKTVSESDSIHEACLAPSNSFWMDSSWTRAWTCWSSQGMARFTSHGWRDFPTIKTWPSWCGSVPSTSSEVEWLNSVWCRPVVTYTHLCHSLWKHHNLWKHLHKNSGALVSLCFTF